MSGFPRLEPAFTARLNPADGFQVGDVSSGGSLNVVPINSGSLVSESGFPVPIDAEVVYGSDYVRVEQFQSHVRINVNAILKNKADGAFVSYSYKGIVAISPEFVAISTGSPEAKTTDYGNAFTQITFETGAEPLKPLEHGLFVGSAHFVIEGEGDQKTFYVESKVSRVVK